MPVLDGLALDLIFTGVVARSLARSDVFHRISRDRLFGKMVARSDVEE